MDNILKTTCSFSYACLPQPGLACSIDWESKLAGDLTWGEAPTEAALQKREIGAKAGFLQRRAWVFPYKRPCTLSCAHQGSQSRTHHCPLCQPCEMHSIFFFLTLSNHVFPFLLPFLSSSYFSHSLYPLGVPSLPASNRVRLIFLLLLLLLQTLAASNVGKK